MTRKVQAVEHFICHDSQDKHWMFRQYLLLLNLDSDAIKDPAGTVLWDKDGGTAKE